MPADQTPTNTAPTKAEVALEVLARLSERSTNGRLRDAIATVRSALWDEVDGPTTPTQEES